MSETQVKIDINVIFTRNSTTNTNMVEISVTRDTEFLLLHKEDGQVVIIGETIASPFPNPNILFDNIVSFDSDNIHSLLIDDSTLREYPILCCHLASKIAQEAAEKARAGPLHISLGVRLTPQRFTEEEEEDVMETCAICLQEDQDLTELPNCSHVFHDECIMEWVCRSNTCPLCRVVVDDEEDDHEFYDFPELEA
ncbi:unnamed protein product [Cochlearia groenlandica]